MRDRERRESTKSCSFAKIVGNNISQTTHELFLIDGVGTAVPRAGLPTWAH